MHAGVLNCFSHVLLFVILWTVALQSLSMGFSREEYWSGVPLRFPGDLSHPGMEPASLVTSALAGGFSAIAPLVKPTFTPSQSTEMV